MKEVFNWEMWTAISTVFLGVVAVLPIIKEHIQKRKYLKILRVQIYTDIRDINESYRGEKDLFEKGRLIDDVKVPDHDFGYFNNLSDSFEKSTYLTSKEKDLIGSLIKVFRKGSYNVKGILSGSPHSEYSQVVFCKVVDKNTVFEIVRLSTTVMDMLEQKM
jgi:hypothetical protein